MKNLNPAAMCCLLLAMMLSACGGGGGGSSAMNMTPSENPTRIPVVAVQAEGNPVEGGEVRIRATSDIPAPEGGLPVRVNVDGALPNDIDSSACTGVVCTVLIPAGRREAVIVITPRADSTTETAETWTIRLGDSSNYDESPTQILIIFVVRDAPQNTVEPDLITQPDPTPFIELSHPFSVQFEGSQVVVTVTSHIPAPSGGLTVTIDITGAEANEFDSAACTGLSCAITISAGMSAAELTLTLHGGDEAEAREIWNLAIADSSHYESDGESNLFVGNHPLREGMFGGGRQTISELNLHARPTILSANQIRAGGDNDAGDSTRQILSITGQRHNNPDGNPHFYVQQLQYAALGIWVNDAWAFQFGASRNRHGAVGLIAPRLLSDAQNGYRYTILNENIVSSLPTRADNVGTAIYDIEGDATFRSVNFFPDGSLTANFNTGTFRGQISANGSESADDFGSANAMVPGRIDDNGMVIMRQVNSGDSLTLSIDNVRILRRSNDPVFNFFPDVITPWTSNHTRIIETSRYPVSASGTGFFAALNNRGGFEFTAHFHDAANYDPALTTPAEISGFFRMAADIRRDSAIRDYEQLLHMGFLGKRR